MKTAAAASVVVGQRKQTNKQANGCRFIMSGYSSDGPFTAGRLSLFIFYNSDPKYRELAQPGSRTRTHTVLPIAVRFYFIV
jgi:hypothetical protein